MILEQDMQLYMNCTMSVQLLLMCRDVEGRSKFYTIYEHVTGYVSDPGVVGCCGVG